MSYRSVFGTFVGRLASNNATEQLRFENALPWGRSVDFTRGTLEQFDPPTASKDYGQVHESSLRDRLWPKMHLGVISDPSWKGPRPGLSILQQSSLYC